MNKIQRFNESKSNTNKSQEDFNILRKELKYKLKDFLEIYDDFLDELSPKHWRSSGHFYTEFKKFGEEIDNWTEVTDNEAELDWVKEQRYKKK
jgi:hypothetical protein